MALKRTTRSLLYGASVRRKWSAKKRGLAHAAIKKQRAGGAAVAKRGRKDSAQMWKIIQYGNRKKTSG